jgi:DNA (cytosine-5)-methyltransferase 1
MKQTAVEWLVKELNPPLRQTDVSGSAFTHLGLFEGIGGFSLAARWMGWETLAWCEWNEFGQRILRHHFPEAEGFGDITKTDFTKYANRIDILTGGFPCQPYSLAGKRKGKEDERHLWPEMLRAIREIRPPYVVGENVFGLINWNGGMVFNEVQTDLEAEGYEVWAYVLPACAINAPHRRDRVWFVAYNQHNGNRRREQQQKSEQETNRTSENTGSNGCTNGEYDKQISKRNEWEFGTGSKERIFVGEALQNDTNTDCDGCDQCNGNNEKHTSKGGFDALNDIKQAIMHTNGTSKQGKHIGQTREGQFNGPDSRNGFDNFQNFPTQSPICGGDDGLPTELDGITFPKWRAESIKAYGNAIVPQVAYEIFKSLEAVDGHCR